MKKVNIKICDKQAVVDAVAKSKGLTPFNTKASTNKDAPLEERIQPPVEQWLRGFIDAEFVIADSFHACVFAIIFNKPFIAYGNKARGASRFQSLLKMFGLEHQLISSAQELKIEKYSEINWANIKYKYELMKKSSSNLLSHRLK